jgi:hypothetical protein
MTTKPTQHTPTPWTVAASNDWDVMQNTIWAPGEEKGIAGVFKAENAAHIVKCVNSHEEARALLQWVVDISNRAEDIFDEEGFATDEWNNLIGQIEKLISSL